MTDDRGKKNDLVTLYKIGQSLGVKKEVIQYHVEVGNMELIDGKVSKSIYEKILEQKASYIGLKSFLKKHDNGRFESKYAKNRNKYIDFLEYNEYFGIRIIDSEDILFDLPEREDFYIAKEDVQLLEYKSERFFREFGLTEQEKIKRIINHSKNHLLTTEYIKKYLSYIKTEDNIYTPALTTFVRTIFDMADIRELSDEDIISVIEDTDTVKVKILLADFFKYVSERETVKYHNIELKKKESISEPAYSYEDYIKLANILFNNDYDKEHNLTFKALENSNYAEMWMFLSCHYVCGWRASAICDRWIYPALKSNDNPFKINIDTLKEDILNGNISDKTYNTIALNSIRGIEMANSVPQKGGEGKLRSNIVYDLRVFFGKLILIAEYHHITSGEGYMNSHRTALYRNWVKCKEFFGDDIFSIIGTRSISSRRLNKSYLQGIEKTTRENGNTTLVAHVVASFARNHANIDTTAIYLKDHGLTGESADVVLYMMMQRGVFSVSLYTTLVAAYPEAFEKLSMKEQTAIMEKISISGYELETLGHSLIASNRMAERLAKGETKESLEILKTMFAIGQGKGRAKDEGVYCKRRALGFSCEKPTCNSCIANLCQYHVFTSEGIPALIKVIKDYQEKALITGNKKYEIVLRKKIIPAFQDIINAIIKEMSDGEKIATRKLIAEALDG